ncbi:hypothetical protein FSP39_012849 [Pinctada imbricata]|uniref:Acyltransferase 3 domain-containing protein n=1 Tax=Pinctada imbricata TaxID=66713 RepID=A0AA88XFK2_PINIB|nr:hypothetical protein FSP39_012849 [Pinctada imbricata]
MRVLSMWWVILGHTYVFTGTFLNNGLDAAMTLPGRWTFQPILQGTLSVDTFFFMSGLLVAYITLKKMAESEGRLNWIMFYFHRFWRLTPTYALFILIWAELYRHFIKGPLEIMFNKGGNFRTLLELCQDKWWTNLLYINNFYPNYGDVNQQCMGWSWYLANDMQFFILSPIFIILLYRWRRAGIVVTIATIACCIIARAVTVYELGIYIPSVQTPTKHVNDGYAKGSRPLYDKPYTRIAPYMVGMLLGYILQRTDCRVRVHKVFFLIGWCLAMALGLSVTYGLLDYSEHPHQGSMFASIMYISLDRFVWSLACAWVVFACSTGNGGLINDILSWKAWAPLGRLTYCAYIVHPAVLFYFLFNLKSTIHYDDNIGAFRFVGNMVMSYMVAYVYSMLIEAPMLGLERLVFRRR